MEPIHSAVAPRSTGRLLTALVTGGLLAILDTTIVTIGLETIGEQLDVPISALQWVSTAYLLALALVIPFVGWAQTRFGGKRLWLFALGLFVAGSMLCATAWNIETLVAFRVVQGIGGGIMFPLMQTLAMQSIAPEDRTKTIARVSLPVALGPILGPALGGLVLHFLPWPWLFGINLPIGVAGLVLAALWLPDDRPAPSGAGPRLDGFGAILLVPALAGLLYGLSNAHAAGGFGRPDVFLPAGGGSILLVGFVVWAARRGPAALVDVRLLAVSSLRASSLVLTLFGVAIFASAFVLPLYLQVVGGRSVLAAGVLLIPQGVGSLVARFVAAGLVDRFGSRAVTVAGFLVIAVATVPFAIADPTASQWELAALLLVRGLGLGVVLIPVVADAYVGLRNAQMPDASAITRIVQQLGGTFGIALVSVVLAAGTTASGVGTGFAAAFWFITAATIVAALIGLTLQQNRTHEEVLVDTVDAATSTSAPEVGSRFASPHSGCSVPVSPNSAEWR